MVEQTGAVEETDVQLVERAKGGSSEAFGELVERYQAPLYRFLLVRSGMAADAEELTQESFLKAWRNLGLYDSRWRFSTWLYTLAKRIAVSHRRAAAVVGRAPAGGEPGVLEGLSVDEDPARIVGEAEERAHMWEVAAGVLSDEQRSALWLRYADDASMEEIARVLGRPRVTVRVLLFRARERLARHLRQDDIKAGGAGTPAHGGSGGRP